MDRGSSSVDAAREVMAEPAVEVRIGRAEDRDYAAAAARMIRRASRENDIAEREESLLLSKIERGRSVLALSGDRLVGFGFFSVWEGGAFVSHSGLVVHEDFRGHGLARQLKECLFTATRAQYPHAKTMSLTSSPIVRKLNLSLGFRDASFEELTTDPEFWAGCNACRNVDEMREQGKQCCCEGMLLETEEDS